MVEREAACDWYPCIAVDVSYFRRGGVGYVWRPTKDLRDIYLQSPSYLINSDINWVDDSGILAMAL